MFILITGGTKNGKSAIAEDIVVSSGLSLYYVATMEPHGADALEAIERHRKMRKGKGFRTVEKYTDISQIPFPVECAVLIECIGNLCANEMFTAHCGKVSEKIYADTAEIAGKVRLLVAVTSQTGGDGIVYEKETMEYISELGVLNCKLSDIADCVIEVVYGIPVVLKGEKPECLL